MTIKILKKGKKSFGVSCSKCSTKFSYELADLKTRYTPVATEGVSCPECGEFVMHRGGGWP